MTDEANALVERCKGHTPGPWAYRDSKIVAVNVKPDWVDLDEDDANDRVSVVDLYRSMGGIDTYADAQLIAAAPELLALIETQAREIERLRRALTSISNLSPAVTHGWAEEARQIAHTALGDSLHNSKGEEYND